MQTSHAQTHRHTYTCPPTAVQCRTNREVAALCVEWEFVDVHLASADDLQVFLRGDRPIVAHKHEGVEGRLIFLGPDTDTA